MVNTTLIDSTWDTSIVPALTDYIRIPNKSPHFDPAWREHGHMAAATQLIADWCKKQPVKGLTVEIVEHAPRTPIIFMEVPATTPGSDDAVLLYGHLDKQPEMSGWAEGLSPWTPVLRGDKLYGRGGADDGYAAFASLTAIAALQQAGIPHARLVIVIEASEESGSPDLPHYIEALAARIGKPSLVVCLDSGCGNYDQLWSTTSLRGLVGGTLSIEVLTEGVHSGDASGIVPSSFRVLRQLLTRLEDETTGRVKLPALHVDIPEQRIAQARTAAGVLKDEVWDKFPFAEGVRPVSTDLVELTLNRTWRPTLSVTGRARPAAHRERRQRPAAHHQRAAEPAPAADLRSQGGVCGGQGRARARPAVRRARALRGRLGPPAGTPRLWRRGWRPRWRPRPRPPSARRRCTWARVAPSRSWACWAPSSRPRSS
jgi:acetylornithine deacetylase/succinyl-diaminopimelate desuccinylase-like protein